MLISPLNHDGRHHYTNWRAKIFVYHDLANIFHYIRRAKNINSYRYCFKIVSSRYPSLSSIVSVNLHSQRRCS
jgi:hypothetical protein